MTSSDVVEMLKDIARPVGHADTVLQIVPEWVRANTARALTGVSREMLNAWASKGDVVAKKLGQCVVYRYTDILKTIESAPTR